MSDPRELLRSLLDACPGAEQVTTPRAWLLALLVDPAENASESRQDAPGRADYTVADLAARFGRSPSTVRGWLERGTLRGYRLLGREWRVTAAELAAFEEAQRRGARHSEAPHLGGSPTHHGLSDWRKVAKREPTKAA